MKRTIEKAIKRLTSQGMTPLSPCEVDSDGRVRMCTAAAVAAAGLEERFGGEASRQFEQRLMQQAGVSALYEAFARLDLPRSLCDSMKIYNDSVPHLQRREAVVNFLAELPV